MAWDVVSGVQTTSFVVIPGGRIEKNLFSVLTVTLCLWRMCIFGKNEFC